MMRQSWWGGHRTSSGGGRWRLLELDARAEGSARELRREGKLVWWRRGLEVPFYLGQGRVGRMTTGGNQQWLMAFKPLMPGRFKEGELRWGFKAVY
jgi:hypothetical protein